MNKKSGNVNGDIVVSSRPTDISTRSTDIQRSPEQSRIAQLEQNIRFLQEQHQLMLTGLHNEIEKLKTRNRGKPFMIQMLKGHFH